MKDDESGKARQERPDQPMSQRSSQVNPGKEVVKTIFIGIAGTLGFWAIFYANEGIAVEYPWTAVFFTVIGGGIGIVVGLPWARRVLSWNRIITFVVTGLLGAAIWGLAALGMLVAPLAAVLTAVLLSLMRLRQVGVLRWPW